MASATTPAALPDYIQSAKPNPPTNRAAWYLNTAPTYAGIFLWFVFWDELANNGLSAGGLGMTLLGVLVGGLICHFLFYCVPGLLGMKTGLPLYIVGTSTFGATGGLLMPGFLMGLLQFGWLAVNAYFSSVFLSAGLEGLLGVNPAAVFYPLCVVWVAGAALVGLKGIQYVAKVATFLPLIPLVILLLALGLFGPSAGSFTAIESSDWGGSAHTVLTMAGAIVGFFATAGAAGVDFGMNARDQRDVTLGGIGGVLIATLLTAGGATIAVAGAHSLGALPNQAVNQKLEQKLRDENASEEQIKNEVKKASHTLTNALRSEKSGLHQTLVAVMVIGLTLAAFPGACFSSFIAANSFKTVMPKVNSFVSVGIGAAVSIALATTGLAKNLPSVFIIIGASFGPICGAMCADYLLAGQKWAGPRAGFNPAGWAAWLLGFIVGILPNLGVPIPAAPVFAYFVGLGVYFALARAGLQSPVIPYGPAADQQAG